MKDVVLYLAKTLLLAAAYYGAGKLSVLLAIPPGFATPVWPAAGVALAAILLWGYRYLPAVFLGSFATNLLIASQGGADVTSLGPLLIGSGIAVGAVLQAALGGYLVRCVLVIPTALSQLSDIVSLLVRGGIIGCVVNALLGPFVLLLAGIIPDSVFLVSAVTWWVGDVIGVVLFAPILLLLANVTVSKLRKAVVTIPILVFAALAIFIFFNAKDEQKNSKQGAFDTVARDIATELEKDAQAYINILTANGQFISASHNVSHKEFTAFTGKFLELKPSILSLSWNRKVTDEKRDAHIEEIRKQGFLSYVIKDRFGVGKVEPAARRKVYFPVTYLSPYDRNEAAHGFDTYGSDEVTGNIRQKVLDQARDEARPIATGRISIVQAEGQYGLLIYNPVYSTELNDSSVASRREHLIGYTAGVFVMPEMLASVTHLADKAGIDIVLRDVTVAEHRQLLYDSRTEDYQESLAPIAISAGATQSLITLDVAGHVWELRFIQKAGSIVADQGWGLWYLLVGGLLLSGVFGVFLLGISANMESIQKELEGGREEDKEGEDVNINFLIITKVAGAFLAFWGCVVIAGWHMKSTAFIQIHSSFVPMEYNTALGFLLSGVGVMALLRKRVTLVLVCGIAVGGIGIFTLAQYILGINLGIDQFLMEHYVSSQASQPGRMAPNTALCFLLVGLALLGTFFIQKQVYINGFLRMLGSLVLALGVFAFIGYVGGLEAAYGWVSLSRMAIHIAVGFMVLGIGIIAYTWGNKIFRWEYTSPFWVPGLVFAIATLFSIALWQEFSSQEQNLVKASVTEEQVVITHAISNQINHTVTALQRMAQRWEAQEGTPKEEWRSDAKHYIEDFNGLTTIEWVDGSYHIRWAEPLEGNEKALGLNIAFDEARKRALEGAAEKNQATLTPPLDLVQGYRAFISYIPIYVNGQFDGFIVGVYDINSFLQEVLSAEQLESFNIQILDGEKIMFQSSDGSESNAKFSTQKTLEIFNREWLIDLSPKVEFLAKQKSYLPEISLLGGALFSLLIGLVTYAAIISTQRSKLLHKRETALRNSEERHRSVVENAVDGLITIDARGIIESFNPACEVMFGYEAHEVVGETVNILMQESHRSKHDGYLQTYRDTGSTKILGVGGREVEVTHKDGTVFLIDLSVSEIVLGNERKFSGIVRDITERKALEKEREQLIDKLSDSNEELERFAYICSHDMQEPLRMIRSFSEKLQDHIAEVIKDDEKGQHYFRFVIDGAIRAQQLIADILAYSSVDQSTQKPQDINMNKLVEVVQENMQVNLEECDGSITHDDLPNLKGNKTQLYQLLQNLINNGLKYQKPNTKPHVHVGVRSSGKHWKFSIKDNGIGMEEHHLKKIFDVFQRLHRKEEYAGTGVGLSICKKVVERHGGKIWVESEKDKGSTFIFTILKPIQEDGK